MHLETLGGTSRVYVTSGHIISVSSPEEIHLTSERTKIHATEDFQVFAKNMRLSAQEDMQQIAGKRFGAYSVQDMTVASQSNMHVGAHGSVQVGAGAHMQVNGQTLQVESGSTLNVDGPKVSINEGPTVKNLPQVKQPTVDAPAAPTFATPHP